MGMDVGEDKYRRLIEVLDPFQRPRRLSGAVLGVLFVTRQAAGRRPRPDWDIEVPGGVSQQPQEALFVLGFHKEQRVTGPEKDAEI